MIRISRGDGSGCVTEEQNDLQEGFFFIDRARFLLPGHKGWRSLGGDAEHVRRRSGPDVLELALEEGIGPQEGVGRRGWKRGTH